MGEARGAGTPVEATGLLQRDRTALVVVDLQEAFRKVIPAFEDVARRSAILVQGAHVLGVPVIVTEQYPKGLGATVPEIAEHLEGEAPLEKLCFPSSRAEGFDLGGRDQVLVAGIETHICVNQTVHDLLARGAEVHVAADAVASRADADREVGLRKMERSGAVITSTETALFELLEEAGTPEFKSVQRLVI
jgi:nicotinamidase-related amidase